MIVSSHTSHCCRLTSRKIAEIDITLLHETLNDLRSNAKSVSIDLLNARLADAIGLSRLTKQAYWSLTGIQFITVQEVHEMLDLFRKDVDAHVDTMAERIAQLGGIALGTTQAVAAKTPSSPIRPTSIKSPIVLRR